MHKTHSETPGDRVVVAIAAVFYVCAAFYLATPFMPGDDLVLLTITTAVAGALGALVIAYINSFLKEQYVRHLDAAAIAGGLAGELSSYAEAWPLLRGTLEAYLELLDAKRKDLMMFRPFDRPKDAFYEANVGKLGLLASELVRDVVYVYGNVGGFRTGFGILQTHGPEMNDAELRGRVLATMAALDRAVERGTPLVEALNTRAKSKFWASRAAS